MSLISIIVLAISLVSLGMVIFFWLLERKNKKLEEEHLKRIIKRMNVNEKNK